MLLFLIAGSLVARSASDIWMIQSVTMIESTIIQMDRRQFLNTLTKYCTALPLVKSNKCLFILWFFFSRSILNDFIFFVDCRYK